MEVVFDTLWKATSFGLQTSPLALVNSFQHTVKSAPQKLLRNFYNSRVVDYTLQTAPAELINAFYKPIKSPKTEEIINGIREKAPFVDKLWDKLNVTPMEWYNYCISSLEPHPNEDIGLTTVEMIRRRGYPLEVYKDVMTEDGYLLEVYRIPHGLTNKSDVPKPVVFLVHGYITSSADYLMAGPDRALAYLLADMGYDVWLGNYRGSLYSRKHAMHDPDRDSEFWKFSFHEIGVYDLPAMIDLILNTTKQETITYIGMSQGTAVFFTMASERPEYNKRINLMVALAPVAHMSGLFSSVKPLIPVVRSAIHHARNFIRPREFPGKRLHKIMCSFASMCHSEGLFQDVLINICYAMFGHNPGQLNKNLLPVLMSTVPHTSSTNQIIHFGQVATSGKFRKFDHGRGANLTMYGTEEPPEYDFGKVEAPVALFYSTGDRLSKSEDVMTLYNSLPNCVLLHQIEDSKFNHMDYVAAVDVVPLLYEHVQRVLGEYNPCELLEW